MKFKDLYEKGLERKVNPAVSASDLSDDTVLTEITEYYALYQKMRVARKWYCPVIALDLLKTVMVQLDLQFIKRSLLYQRVM